MQKLVYFIVVSVVRYQIGKCNCKKSNDDFHGDFNSKDSACIFLNLLPYICPNTMI